MHGELFDLAYVVCGKRSPPVEALRPRGTQHERMPSQYTYTTLRTAADVGAWNGEHDAARAALRALDPGALVDARAVPPPTHADRNARHGQPTLTWAPISSGRGDPENSQQLLRSQAMFAPGALRKPSPARTGVGALLLRGVLEASA